MVERIGAAQVRFAFILQAAPADHGGLAFVQHPFRQGHAPQTFRATGPLVAGEGIDVSGGSSVLHRNLPETLGGIHQQIGRLGVLGEPFRDGGDGHDLARVPEQMTQHHQPRAGGEALLQGVHHARIGAGLIAAQLLHRQGVDRQPLTPGQLHAGGHNPRVFAVADQQTIATVEGQSPQRQHTTARDVFTEGQAMGGHAAELGEAPPGAGHLGPDEWPYIRGEGAQLLNAPPAGLDRLQRWRRQGALAAVVEVGLV